MAGYGEIDLDIVDGVATLTLNRPGKLNAFTATMMEEMLDALDRTDADDDVRAVIFTGAGNRAFCAGADLTPESGGGPFSCDEQVTDLADEKVRDGGGLVTLRIFQSRKPVIGAINGAAVGFGATLQLPMDFRMASTDASFGFVFSRRGIVIEFAGAWFLPRLVGMQQALEWCMTGRIFKAVEAHAAGLVRSLHAPGDLLEAAHNFAREISDGSSGVSIAVTRAMLWRLSAAEHPMAAHRIDSRAIYSLSRGADAAEGVASFLDRRPPQFQDRVSRDLPEFFPWWNEPEWM